MTTPTSTASPTAELSRERADLLQSLRLHRGFLIFTTQGLTDEQAAQRTTVSALCLGGLIKHVAQTEAQWAAFIVDGPIAHGGDLDWSEATPADAASDLPPPVVEAWLAQHQMLSGETLEGLLANYARVASHTDHLVQTLPDLDAAQPLPAAPWFEAGASWSARRTLLHVIAETAQHAGHADIIREALDGQKTMG